MISIVDRLLELSKVDDFMSARNRKEIESIKKQLEENADIVERLKYDEHTTGRALVDVQNWLSPEGKMSTEIINRYLNEILGEKVNKK